MAEIKCPKCGTVFTVNESEYNDLLNQIRSEEFEKELNRRLEDAKKAKDLEIKLAKEESNKASEDKINELNRELDRLKSLAALNEVKAQSSKAELEAKYKAELERLNKDLESAKKETEHAVKEAISAKDIEIVELQGKIASKDSEYKLKEQNLKSEHANVIKAKDETIAFYKDLKTKASTKMLGETLEQHCKNSFEMYRAVCYPNAYFEKDNDASDGTKGDFIFRDYTDQGVEFISIMFEMKNEADETATKHKNEDFFKKLDEDRTKKGCEYAVLVSTLEADSDLYNSGIVDVSYKYPKMFVVRPQNFMAIIGLLYNAARNSIGYKNELQLIRNENVDITNFENAVKLVAQKINDDYENAGKQYDKVEKMCDDMIKKLTDLKEAFRLGKKWIGTAQNQLPELEIRKLTKNNPTMKEKFDEVNKSKK